MIWLSLNWSPEECVGQGMLVCVLKAMNQEWFDYSFPRLIDSMEVDPTLAFVSVAILRDSDRDVLRSHDWFPYENKTGKLSRVDGLAKMI